MKKPRQMSITPDVWGPYAWMFLGYVALGFPNNPSQDDHDTYRRFFTNIWKVLPCYKCALNYQRHLNEMPPIEGYLVSGDKLFEWVWMLHNIVNKELGKPEISLHDAMDILINGGLNKTYLDTASPTNSSTRHEFYIRLICLTIIPVLGIFTLLLYSHAKKF